ncbi:MAG: hypothetical protein J6T48_10550 [Bacteroidales bacterium]|nr:hypothetical protein [Bacteroidales bacterium]
MENSNPKVENYTSKSQENALNNIDNPPKVEIEINKYKNLVRALNEPKMLAKVIIVTTTIVILVFLGVSLVALMIKKFYPYKAINSNEYGATFIENEDSEVIYWLFNTADLWANSGIKVHKGDVLTIHTSGAFHSAVHHLVDDAKNNRMSFNWMEANGGFPNNDPREKERAKYRIVNKYNNNTILMQVLPDDYIPAGKNEKWWKGCSNDSVKLDHIDGKGNSARIYAIGKDIENIEIQEDGILSFSINEVAFTKRNIVEMYKNIDLCNTTDTLTIAIDGDNVTKQGVVIKRNDKIKIDSSGNDKHLKIIRKLKKDKSVLKIGDYPTLEYVKDIKVLTDSMNIKWLKFLNINVHYNELKKKYAKKIDSLMEKFYKHNELDSELLDELSESAYKKLNALSYSNVLCDTLSDNQRFDELADSLKSKLKIDSIKQFVDEHLNELDYYYITDFVDAWCADNVGSFLIVIERKRK